MGFIPKDLTRKKLDEIQLEGLKWTVSHVLNHSPFYREKLSAAGIAPDDIRTLEDIRHLPFTDKKDLQQNYPFPLRAASFGDIVRIHASSGTTGKRKVLSYSQKDIDTWADMFARCYELAGLSREDRVQIAVGYGTVVTRSDLAEDGCPRFLLQRRVERRNRKRDVFVLSDVARVFGEVADENDDAPLLVGTEGHRGTVRIA